MVQTLLEVKHGFNSFILKISEELSKQVSKLVPFKTVLRVWKEEVYFETPLKLKEGFKPHLEVEPGKLYYWRPGRGFCIFYGLSQPYSEVYHIGEHVGVLCDLRDVEDGSEAEVSIHKPAEGFKDLTDGLRGLGYLCGTPLADGQLMVAAVKNVKGFRLGLNVYVEEYGYHVELEPFYQFSNTLPTLSATLKLKQEVRRLKEGIRLDLNEDLWVTLTALAKKPNELLETVKRAERIYVEIRRKLPSWTV